MRGFGGGGGDDGQLRVRIEYVTVSAEEELGNGAVAELGIAEIVTGGIMGGQAEEGQGADVFSSRGGRAAGAERHHGAEAEADHDHGEAEFVFQPIKRGEEITGLGLAVVDTVARVPRRES